MRPSADSNRWRICKCSITGKKADCQDSTTISLYREFGQTPGFIMTWNVAIERNTSRSGLYHADLWCLETYSSIVSTVANMMIPGQGLDCLGEVLFLAGRTVVGAARRHAMGACNNGMHEVHMQPDGPYRADDVVPACSNSSGEALRAGGHFRKIPTCYQLLVDRDWTSSMTSRVLGFGRGWYIERVHVGTDVLWGSRAYALRLRVMFLTCPLSRMKYGVLKHLVKALPCYEQEARGITLICQQFQPLFGSSKQATFLVVQRGLEIFIGGNVNTMLSVCLINNLLQHNPPLSMRE